MPKPGQPLERLGFLTIGSFDPDDPGAGHETTLKVMELGEQLGFDSAWLRHRHLQHGISSPVAVLAAASQRTSRIEFGTAVTPLGWENPLRLAEDLATVDVLSGGRLNPGFSSGTPMHWDDVKAALYPDTADIENLTYERALRLLRLVAGEPASDFEGVQGIEVFSRRVQPHSPGLRSRMWMGAGSLNSARWAGEHGLNLLTSSVIGDDGSLDFAQIQAAQIQAFRAVHPAGVAARVSQGLVVIPTDSATPAQREKYTAYVEARTPRTRVPQGPAKLLFAVDLVGTSAEIAEKLYAHAGFREVREVAFALPFSFEEADYVQILTDIATHLGPELGWKPAS
jgi:alkanesulfonate monooxygenase SsuD/methylene tetrahydromethanopterin reductase-like flavin-dependent oxidoreductase (luciferase family)